jgi:hypothetical protein
MALFDKSVLKPEGSIVAGIATAGLVYSVYQMDVGPVAQVQMTDPNHPALEASRKKAGYTAFILVAGLTLISRDTNVGVLGFASIIAMEAHYRHAIMADAITGIMQPPSPTKYEPAENVVQLPVQGTSEAGYSESFGY